MKLFRLLIPVLLLGLISCTEEKKTEYTVSINSTKLYNGVRSYIKALNEKGEEVIIDSAIAMNNELKFMGSVQDPTLGFLNIDGMNGQIMLFVENEDITIELDTLNMALSKIKGSELNNELSSFNKEFMEIRMAMQPNVIAFRQARRDNDNAAMDSLNVLMKEQSREALYYPLDYIKSNPNSFFSVFVLDSQIGSSSQITYEEILESYNAIDTSLLSSPMGLRVQNKMELERLKYEKEKVTAIGAKAPEFSAPMPNGDILALSDVYSKGTITIVDFWAAWCGPCRRENPNVVRIYEKYHDKGLQIIGVSLDGNRNQKDPKGAWLKAIEDDKLTWNHVSNLQYFGPIARQYNVNAIPAMFILDSNGTIIAKNLRGAALENKVAELLTP